MQCGGTAVQAVWDSCLCCVDEQLFKLCGKTAVEDMWTDSYSILVAGQLFMLSGRATFLLCGKTAV
jgi:hypothetical protein